MVVQIAARSVRLEHERVDDLVEPVGQPDGEAGGHDVEAPALDLVGVRVDHEREQRDGVPLELRRVAEVGARLRGWRRCGRRSGISTAGTLVGALTARSSRRRRDNLRASTCNRRSPRRVTMPNTTSTCRLARRFRRRPDQSRAHHSGSGREPNGWHRPSRANEADDRGRLADAPRGARHGPQHVRADPRRVGGGLARLIGARAAVPRTGVRAHPSCPRADRDGRRDDLPLRHRRLRRRLRTGAERPATTA